MVGRMQGIRAVLLDLDGTLYVGNRWLPGALETVQRLVDAGITVRFITNTTMRNRRQLQERFTRAGLPVPREWFLTPTRVAQGWLATQPLEQGVLALVHPNLLEDLADIPLRERAPADVVLVGDMGDTWRVERLNEGLRALLEGAQLTALQKGRYWLAEDGYRLDAGAFAAALEYASGARCAIVFGKPNRVFFQMALQDAGVAPSEALMVGDDVRNDVLAAQELGLHAALVRTGKFRAEDLARAPGQPEAILNDVTEVPALLGLT